MPNTIFVSSTFVDLKSHRKLVWETLTSFDLTVRGMEQFGARTETPLQTCLIEVDQSDIYVGIIGFRLGSVDQESGKSYTQLEYERAVSTGKEIFIYFMDEQNAFPRITFVDHGEPWEKLNAFKGVLRQRHTIDTFVDEKDLAAKLGRKLEGYVSPRVIEEGGLDEYTVSNAKLGRFFLLPKSVAGTEVRLCMKIAEPAYPASREVCAAFNLEFGATLGVNVSIVRPEGVTFSQLPDLFIDARHALDLLPLQKGDVIDGYVKLHFFDSEIEQLRARFKPETRYPNSPFSSNTIRSYLGEPVHYRSDSRMAFELSRVNRILRGE